MMIIPLFVLSLLGTCSAFYAHLPFQHSSRLESTAVAEDQFYRAVELADSLRQKKVDIDELDRLATELENVDLGCQFESPEDSALCDKEIQDRLDVAEILRLQIELQLRLDYLQKANLFADDVRKTHDKVERQKSKDALIANRDKSPGGSDLGLW